MKMKRKIIKLSENEEYRNQENKIEILLDEGKVEISGEFISGGLLDISDKDSEKIIFVLNFKIINSVAGDGNRLLVSPETSMQEFLKSFIVPMNEINKLPKLLTQRYHGFGDLKWDDLEDSGEKYFGLLTTIKSLFSKMPQVFIKETGLGFTYFNGNPRFYSLSKTLRINKKSEYIPTADLRNCDCICKTNLSSVSSAGSSAAVCNLINEVSYKDGESKPYLQSALSAAMSSIIVGLLDLPSFTFSLAGNTSLGKTTVLKLCTSLFAECKNENLFYSLSSTAKKLDASMANKHGVPIVFDDTSTDSKSITGASVQKRENDIKNLVYRVATNGTRGKIGSDSQPFHIVCMLSSEISLKDAYDMYDDGSNRRIIELKLDNYGNHLTDDARQARKIEHVIRSNYGIFAEEFVKKLLDKYSIDDIRKMFDEICFAIQEEMPNDGASQAYSELVACVSLASRLLHELFLINFNCLEIEDFLIDSYMQYYNENKEQKMAQELKFNEIVSKILVQSMVDYRQRMERENGAFMYIKLTKLKELCAENDCDISSMKKFLKKHNLMFKSGKEDRWDIHINSSDRGLKLHITDEVRSFIKEES